MLKKVDEAGILKSPYELSLNFSFGKHDKGDMPGYFSRKNATNKRSYSEMSLAALSLAIIEAMTWKV